jgi:hypothetical protein
MHCAGIFLHLQSVQIAGVFLNTILAIDPDLVVIGSDWARRDYYKQMGFTQDWLDQRGIGLAYIPYTQGISSTIIKERMTFRR